MDNFEEKKENLATNESNDFFDAVFNGAEHDPLPCDDDSEMFDVTPE